MPRARSDAIQTRSFYGGHPSQGRRLSWVRVAPRCGASRRDLAVARSAGIGVLQPLSLDLGACAMRDDVPRLAFAPRASHGSTAQAPTFPRSTPATRLTAVGSLHWRLAVPLGELEAPPWIGSPRVNARAAETWPLFGAACGGEPVHCAQRTPKPEADSDTFTLLTQGLSRGGAAGREVTDPQDPNLRH